MDILLMTIGWNVTNAQKSETIMSKFRFKLGDKVMGLASSLGLDIVVVGKVATREHRFDREERTTFIGNYYKIVLDKKILPIDAYPRSIAVVDGTYHLSESRLQKFNKNRFNKVLGEWFMFNSAVRSMNRSKGLLYAEMYGVKGPTLA